MDPAFSMTIGKAATWISKLSKQWMRLRSERADEIERLSDTFGSIDELATSYIQPDCQPDNPADQDEDEATMNWNTPVFDRLSEFFDKKIIIRDGRQVVFVMADAGMGKTSLLVMLKLGHLGSFWPPSWNCVLLKLGEGTLEAIERVRGKSNTVLLLDSLDEDPQCWNRFEERTEEILKACKHFKRVIITCRSQYFPHDAQRPHRGRIAFNGFTCHEIYLSLFNDSQCEQYLQKRFSTRWRDYTKQESYSRAWHITGRMRSLRFRPMLLAHIDDLLEIAPESLNEYKVYNQLVNGWVDRAVRNWPEQTEKSPTKHLERDLHAACLAIAKEMQRQGCREIDIATMMKVVGSPAIGVRLSKMEITGRALLNKTSEGKLRFSHYSIQEFLVAKDVLLGHSKCIQGRITGQILRFLCVDFEEDGFGTRRNRFLQSTDLQNADFRGANLRGADLTEINIEGSNLQRANLQGANLQGANLAKANLEEANLQGANLQRANLQGANLQRSILREAKLDETNREGANFTNADLRGTILEKPKQETPW